MDSPGANISLRKVFLSGITFVIFFQLLTEFVESIYLFGLLGSEIPPEIGLVVLFLSPLLLFLLKKQLTTPTGLRILLSIGFLARSIEIMLPTRGRLITSGIGFASILLFFPAFLASQPKTRDSKVFLKQTGLGLSLGLIVLVLARALNSGSDITAQGMFRIISWVYVAVGLVLVWRNSFVTGGIKSQPSNKNRFQIYLYSLGIYSIFILLYFAFNAPNIISRWGGSSNLGIHILLLTSWSLLSYWWMGKERISANLVLISGLFFIICLMLSILPHQVEFPPTMDSGYPLLEPMQGRWSNLPVYVMVALSPILLLAFTNYLSRIISSNPNPGSLAGAFGLGAGYLLIMVLSQVFTTVYDYIPVIGPAFRDKYWIMFLIPSLLTFIPLLMYRNQTVQEAAIPQDKYRILSWLFISLVIISVAGVLFTTANPPTPNTEVTRLRILTYNIQQGFDDQGERNFDGQLKYIRSMSPDIIGLQECDTARIAGGNADVVAYFANHLNMYSYYGPSSVAGTFGIALLSRYPIQNATTYYLFSYGEQVAVIEADLNVGNKTLKVYVTHLGNRGPIFQIQQMLELMEGQPNVIAMGDFNFRPYEEQYAITTEEFLDAYLVAETKTIPTIWGEDETFDIEERIDHIFISQGLHVPYLEYLTQPESDHPGLFAEIGW